MLLRAYGDESGKATPGGEIAISMGTVIAPAAEWHSFELNWRQLLANFEIPYLHMKEVLQGRITGRGPFGRFRDIQDLNKLMSKAVYEIVKSRLHCRAVALFTDGLQRCLEQRGMTADPYSFTLYACVGLLGTWALNNHPDDPSFELVLDRLEKGHAKVAEAEHLYSTDKFMAWRGWPVVTPLPSNSSETSRTIAGLQAADLVAWLTRRHLAEIEEWMRQVKPTLLDFQTWDASLDSFMCDQAKAHSQEMPERNIFTGAFAWLRSQNHLKFYVYDYERIETHIFLNRDKMAQRHAIDGSILRAGRPCPLRY